MTTGSRTTPYARVRPCIDYKGHKFVSNNPEPGQYGTVLIFCERCGVTR